MKNELLRLSVRLLKLITMINFAKIFAMQLTKIILAFTFLGLFSLFSSCVDEEPTIVPDVSVNLYINLSFYNHLSVEGNALKFPNEGYDENGVIVYRLSFEEFLAFDATCPQHIEKSTSINLDNNGTGGTATCPHCSTKYYFINFGQASSGYPLKRYKVSRSGNFLTITN